MYVYIHLPIFIISLLQPNYYIIILRILHYVINIFNQFSELYCFKYNVSLIIKLLYIKTFLSRFVSSTENPFYIVIRPKH